MPEPDKIYYSVIGEHGTFRPIAGQTTCTTASDIDDIFNHLKKTNQKKVALYFHGGLVAFDHGMETAGLITRYITTNTSSHPVSFIWQTGFIETITQNLNTIQNSTFFRKLLIKIIKVAGEKLGISMDWPLAGAKGFGTLTDAEIDLELQKEAPFGNYTVDEGRRAAIIAIPPDKVDDIDFLARWAELNLRAELEEELDDRELEELAVKPKSLPEARLMDENKSGTDDEVKAMSVTALVAVIKATIEIVIRVIRREVKKRDHGFYPTIVEEILRQYYIADLGAWVWGGMKKKAIEMWTEDAFAGAPTNWHAGSYFLRKLQEYQTEVGELTIDLIGHSAGSIVICGLVKAAATSYTELHFRNIIFIAPACRCDLFTSNILPNTAKFRNFRCFTMSDAYEIQDHLLPVIYPRSLLYLISGLLEEGSDSFDAYILGLQRDTLGKEPYGVDELRPIVDFLKQKDHTVYSVTDTGAPEGFRSTSLRHGAFCDDKEPTLDSVMYMLKQD